MRLLIFGLTVSSSWGNGHATLWRGLCRALAGRGHRVTFFEHDVPYYAQHRDLYGPEDYELILYSDWREIEIRADHLAAEADSAIVTSYCPDAREASDLVLNSQIPLRVFYDLDTPVTLARLQAGETVEYLPSEGLAAFDLVLSYAGGRVLEQLRSRLGARRVAHLYGSVDPAVHRPVPPRASYEANLSYLGTYAFDRQSTLDELFLKPAEHCPNKKFLIGGAQYPEKFPWARNISFVRHVPPPEHPAFYCSSGLTLNVTRSAMAEAGYCPSGRLFEAAACGTPIVSDDWEGLENFFEPGREILVARSSSDVKDALAMETADLGRIASAAQERVLAEHTADRRADQMLTLFEEAL